MHTRGRKITSLDPAGPAALGGALEAGDEIVALDGAAVGGRSFRHFRVRQTGKAADGWDNLCCTGIELYGRLATSE